MKRILLVDGTNVVMRFAHAMLPGLVDQVTHPMVEDRLQNVMSGVTTAVRDCARFAGAEYSIVALDSSPSWRKEKFPNYKANRTVGTAWWSDQLVTALSERRLAHVRSPGFEADDLVATLAHRATAAGYGSAVLSGDSDLLVLASDTCDVYQFGQKTETRYARRSPEWIATKYEIANATQLRDFKAIVGEPGDCLPGLDGYGPVKARRLLARFGSADALLASVALTPDQQEQLALMLELVTLRTDVPIDAIHPASCRIAA